MGIPYTPKDILDAPFTAGEHKFQPLSDTIRPFPTGTVTFLFTDIQGSTPLWEREPEKMAEALKIHNAALRQAVEANGGMVFKIVGDAFQAAFATAPHALKAAIEGQRALQAAPWNELGPLRVRMGLHTGEAELDPSGDEYAVSHTKNRVARIMSVAHGGQILLSAETAELVNHQLPPGVTLKDMGEHHLKGLLYPEHVFQVVAPGLPVEFPPLASESRPSHNLPLELTMFIGRQREVTQVRELLGKHRMVTLTGSGGVGKTRLSIQAAGGMLAEFPNGIWYVELAPLSDPDLVPQTVAAVLRLREDPNHPILETLCHFLSQRELLLVLDNCEHLLEACARLADALLRRAPRLKILISSREALGITGETAFRVPSLAVPDLRHMPSLEALRDYEAVQLFAERASAVMPSFQVNAHNAQAIAQICQRLDGIPLAIELAAARLGMLTTEQLASRLDHAFRLLTGGSRTALPRQQTLRGAIDWSYQLLSEPERVLLRRLAVFAGGAVLEGIERVCSGKDLETERILDLLGGLVSKSMVDTERRQGIETRYRLLETVRQYAREKLYDAGESERLRNQHLEYYVAFCEEAYPQIHGAGRIEWTRRLKREYDNIREALEWAFHDSTLALLGLRIAKTLPGRFWGAFGLQKEGTRWLETGLQAAGDALPELLKAEVLCGLNFVHHEEFPKRRAFEQCVALCREIGPEADSALCLVLVRNTFYKNSLDLAQSAEAVRIARSLGAAGAWELGEVLFFYSQALMSNPEGAFDEQALAVAEESLEVNRDGDRWNSPGLFTIGFIQTLRKQDEQGRQAFEKALEVFREVDHFIGIYFSLYGLIFNHRLAGRYQLAHEYCRELYTFITTWAYELGYEHYLYSYGMLLISSLNNPSVPWVDTLARDAVRLFAATSRYLDAWVWYKRLQQADLSQLEQLRHKLGQEAYAKAWKEGEALTLEQAVALALEVQDE